MDESRKPVILAEDAQNAATTRPSQARGSSKKRARERRLAERERQQQAGQQRMLASWARWKDTGVGLSIKPDRRLVLAQEGNKGGEHGGLLIDGNQRSSIYITNESRMNETRGPPREVVHTAEPWYWDTKENQVWGTREGVNIGGENLPCPADCIAELTWNHHDTDHCNIEVTGMDCNAGRTIFAA